MDNLQVKKTGLLLPETDTVEATEADKPGICDKTCAHYIKLLHYIIYIIYLATSVKLWVYINDELV